MAKGFAAILLGHLIGCTMMFFAGLIGGRTGLSAMETSKLSFGKKGSLWLPPSTCCSWSAGQPS